MDTKTLLLVGLGLVVILSMSKPAQAQQQQKPADPINRLIDGAFHVVEEWLKPNSSQPSSTFQDFEVTTE